MTDATPVCQKCGAPATVVPSDPDDHPATCDACLPSHLLSTAVVCIEYIEALAPRYLEIHVRDRLLDDSPACLSPILFDSVRNQLKMLCHILDPED